jgi:hypothetical protein
MKVITDIKVNCLECGWEGTVGECNCDGDYPDLFEDDGRLRCPACVGLVEEFE